MPEFVPDWLEDEMERLGMEPATKATKEATVKVGAAEVVFKEPKEFSSDHPVFDVEEPKDNRSKDELYEAPAEKPFKFSKATNAKAREEQELLVTVANVLGTIELAEGQKTDGEKFGRDAVVLPEHYARYAIEPIRFAVENNLNFLQANIVKYILRFDAKNGMEDLNKAERYLTLLKRFAAKDPDWWKP